MGHLGGDNSSILMNWNDEERGDKESPIDSVYVWRSSLCYLDFPCMLIMVVTCSMIKGVLLMILPSLYFTSCGLLWSLHVVSSPFRRTLTHRVWCQSFNMLTQLELVCILFSFGCGIRIMVNLVLVCADFFLKKSWILEYWSVSVVTCFWAYPKSVSTWDQML